VSRCQCYRWTSATTNSTASIWNISGDCWPPMNQNTIAAMTQRVMIMTSYLRPKSGVGWNIATATVTATRTTMNRGHQQVPLPTYCRLTRTYPSNSFLPVPAVKRTRKGWGNRFHTAVSSWPDARRSEAIFYLVEMLIIVFERISIDVVLSNSMLRD